jgi:hypothetical protein
MNPPEREIETFVSVHDQELVLSCEHEARFARLPHYRYLFVGPRDVSRLKKLDNVIVARELPNNIEAHVNLLSFTAWYAVAKNGLARAPWVTMLEYDVRLAPDFSRRTLSSLRFGRRVIGYVAFPLSHPMYLHATPWLIPALRTAHGIDVPQMVRKHLDAGGVDQWTATTNVSLLTSDLEAFVEWFTPASLVFRHDPLGAHVHERALPVFCILKGFENLLLPDVLEHEQKRSHGIRARSWEEARKVAERRGGL